MKNRPLRIFTSEEDLENMKKNKGKFIQKMGQDTYDRLLDQLQTHINKKDK